MLTAWTANQLSAAKLSENNDGNKRWQHYWRSAVCVCTWSYRCRLHPDRWTSAPAPVCRCSTYTWKINNMNTWSNQPIAWQQCRWRSADVSSSLSLWEFTKLWALQRRACLQAVKPRTALLMLWSWSIEATAELQGCTDRNKPINHSLLSTCASPPRGCSGTSEDFCSGCCRPALLCSCRPCRASCYCGLCLYSGIRVSIMSTQFIGTTLPWQINISNKSNHVKVHSPSPLNYPVCLCWVEE